MKRDFEGGRWVVELRPEGIGRFFIVGFLTFWLAGWAVGEGFACFMLAGMLGLWPGKGVPAVPGGIGAYAGVGFILVWLAFWTLGGLLALMEVLSLLWGVDRIEFDGAGVRLIRRMGPFTRSRWHPRENIRSVAIRARRGTLVLETRRGVVSLTRLGSDEERARLRQEIETALGLSGSAAAAELPDGWESEPTPEGHTVLRRSRSLRVRQARVLWIMTAVFGTGQAWAILLQGEHPGRWVGLGIATLFGLACLIGALAVTFSGDELRLRAGEAERRRRLGPWAWTRVFVPAHVAVEDSVDSDGDHFYQLSLRGAGGRTTVDRALQDPFDLVRLGHWVAEKLSTDLALPAHLKQNSDRVAS